jgi:hypothetical protein
MNFNSYSLEIIYSQGYTYREVASYSLVEWSFVEFGAVPIYSNKDL